MRRASTSTTTSTSTSGTSGTVIFHTSALPRPNIPPVHPEASNDPRAPDTDAASARPEPLAAVNRADADRRRASVSMDPSAVRTPALPEPCEPVTAQSEAKAAAEDLRQLLHAEKERRRDSGRPLSPPELSAFFQPVLARFRLMPAPVRSDLIGEFLDPMCRIVEKASTGNFALRMSFYSDLIKLNPDPVLPWRLVRRAFRALGADQLQERVSVARLSLRIDCTREDHPIYPFEPALKALRQKLLQSDPSTNTTPLALRTFDTPAQQALTLINHAYGEVMVRNGDGPDWDLVELSLNYAFDAARQVAPDDPAKPEVLRELVNVCTDALPAGADFMGSNLAILEWAMPQLDADHRETLLSEQLSEAAAVLELTPRGVPAYPNGDPDRVILRWLGSHVHRAEDEDKVALLRWFASHVHRASAEDKPLLVQRLFDIIRDAAETRTIDVQTLCFLAAHVGEASLGSTPAAIEAHTAMAIELRKLAPTVDGRPAIQAYFAMPALFNLYVRTPITNRGLAWALADRSALPSDWERKLAVIGLIRGWRADPDLLPAEYKPVLAQWLARHPDRRPKAADLAPWLTRRGAAPGRLRFVDFWFTPLPQACLRTLWNPHADAVLENSSIAFSPAIFPERAPGGDRNRPDPGGAS